MHKAVKEFWIKLKGYLNREDCGAIAELQAECVREDGISLKLELDYKLEDAANAQSGNGIGGINEFMAYDGNQLIGYLGICSFGDSSQPLELTGMVRPGYRRGGVFTALHTLAMAECGRRQPRGALGLCDRNSSSGQEFLKRINADYLYSEFEMVLRDEQREIQGEQLCGITFRKAVNADAREIARQNRIYFGHTESESEGGTLAGTLLPEEEEMRGMTIHLAEKNGRVIGKANASLINGHGGIYGLGVLPEYRGKGYGRAILLGSIAKLRDAHAEEIILQVAANNETALKLYQSCGFQETSVMDYCKLI